MENKSENIGDLFKSRLNDFSVEGSRDEWIELDIKLEKSYFFKFRPTHFNIYYSALVGICFLLSTAVFVDHFLIKREFITEKINNEQIEPGQINQDKSIQENKQSNLINPKSIKTKRIIESKYKDSNTNYQENIIPKNNEQDRKLELTKPDILTTETSKENLPEVVSAIPEIKPKKKVVYITKQDTIVVFDTVKTNKTRRRLK
jgi:hypothetical protein